MTDTIISDESFIRFSFFIGIFITVSLLENLLPMRKLTVPQLSRWRVNFGLIMISSLAVQLFCPILPYFFAHYVMANGWGLLNIIELPNVVSIIISVLIFDFVIYAQHVVFHYIPCLWKIHRVHHTDLNLDVTSGFRFHPIEIILSVLIKMGFVLIIGPMPESVLIFEIILSSTALFNHSNIKFSHCVDSLLRKFVVTPNMHSVHHSVIPDETNSNFGFSFPWWDRLCGTYKKQPIKGAEHYTIGLYEYRQSEKLGLLNLLRMPFQKK